MSQIFGFIYTLFTNYLIPLVLAFGLIYFLYGVVNYFILGPGEEPKREEGRHQLLWSFLIFVIGLALYALMAGVLWFSNWISTSVGDLDVEEERRLQQVPNVPQRNN